MSTELVAVGVGLLAVVAGTLFLAKHYSKSHMNVPPMVPYVLPFFGSMIEFGMNPLQFLADQRQKFGDMFTFLMFGRRMTFLLGAEGNNFVLNTCKLKEVSAEEAYKHLTTPVFGEGVVYDVPNHILMDQKKFVKHGLSPENLRLYVTIIEKETRDYFSRWTGDEGVGEIAKAIAELTILTASSCLMGKEIREKLDSGIVAQLYEDLDKGFTPMNFLFPWLPLPSYRKRDIAHIKMRNLFLDIMKTRRNNNDMGNSDMLQALMDSEYTDGNRMTDREVACLMIALLMAGQHTSSTTGTWCLSFLASHPEIRNELVNEHKEILGEGLEKPLDFDALKSMTLLDNCIRETLRMKPPIITIFRKVMETVQYKDYSIPKGDYVCVSPALAQIDRSVWGSCASSFKPQRFTEDDDTLHEALGHGANSSYLPFGAGRHRCIGESFAYIQLKTIISTFIQMFDWEWPEGQGFPKTDFTTLIVMPVKPVNVRFKRRNWKVDTPLFDKEE